VDSTDTAIGIQVVIVDDDRLVRDFAVHTIEYGINRKVTVFDRGLDAWQFLQKRPGDADIIIADANIPDMDGMELLKKVKAKFARKKFILTTSNPDHEDTALQIGADALLSKPYDVNDLFAIVQQFIATPENEPNTMTSDS
jgi:CheY-like chemotaxis protein